MEDTPAGDKLHEVPIDWEALEDAFENNAPEVHSYLHVHTGDVLRVVDGVADPDMHSRIAANSAYMRVEPVSSREQYRWMERFIQMVEDEELKPKLAVAIDGKGAFRRFKDVLMSYNTERERWFAFRSERLRVFMEAWLAAHRITPVPRPEVVAVPDTEPESTPVTQEQIQGRRVRTVESLRRQLHEAMDALGARELEKVLSFAEFVRARRVARGFSPREDAPEESVEDSTDRALTDRGLTDRGSAAQDEPPPSSRKLSTAR